MNGEKKSAQQQYNATTRIARSQAVPGDLVFFFSGGYVTHLGIYLGGNSRGCSQPNLSASWVNTVLDQGWKLLPLYRSTPLANLLKSSYYAMLPLSNPTKRSHNRQSMHRSRVRS